MANVKMGSSAGWNYNYVESCTANFTLGPGDSGKVYILSGSAITVTLPALSDIDAGYCVKLISGDTNRHVVAGANSKLYGYVADVADETTNRVNAASGVTTNASTGDGGAIGNYFDICSDGVNWYISGATDKGV